MKKIMLLALTSITLPAYADSIPTSLKDVGRQIGFTESQKVWQEDDDWQTDRVELMSGSTRDIDIDKDDKDKTIATPEPSSMAMVFFTTMIFGSMLRRKIIGKLTE